VVARAQKKTSVEALIENVAETIYEVVRWKRLYAEIAEVKEPLTEIIFGECLLYGRFLEAIQSDWRQLEGTPERKKDALMNYQK
jgi:16S rRNA (cytosine967-C5)-methyltransferase